MTADANDARTRDASTMGAMTREDAVRALEMDAKDVDALDEKVIKARYRALCLRWHPDKNPDDVERAKERFTEITCAYHTLMTANFDHERWRNAYEIPPLQSLEDVLTLALAGGDPFEIEAMLRARGEYRPHANFGIDVCVPWEAGERPEADFDGGPSAYTKTRALGDGSGADERREMELAWAAKKVAGASEERPWERVGGVGFGGALAGASEKKSLGWSAARRPPTKREDVPPEELTARAERANDAGMVYFGKKQYADALVQYAEATEMAPDKVAYHGNTAAAALARSCELRDGSPEKTEVLELALRACEAAIALDETYLRGYVRAGKALLALGDDREDVDRLKRARDMLSKALELEPASSAAKTTLKDVEISLQLYMSDDE